MPETQLPDPDPLFTESLDLMSDLASAYVSDNKPLDPRSLRMVARNLETLANKLERDHP